MPLSRKCLAKFANRWVSWAGWPVCLTSDRGLHNRGAFSRALGDHCVYQRQAGVEAHEMIGRVERHNGIWKGNMRATVKAHKIVGKQNMKLAGDVVTNNKNDMVRKGGIAPSQWVIGKFPRGVGHMLEEEELGQLGHLHVMMDSTTAFGLSAQYRLTSMKNYLKQDWQALRGRHASKVGTRSGSVQAGRSDLLQERAARPERNIRSEARI